MAWIELHQSVIRHRKTIRAAELLKKPRIVIVGHLVALWCWALDGAPEGGPLRENEIKVAAEWRGNATKLAESLTKVGFLDQRGGSLWLHNWGDYAGRLFEKREKNRERMRAARAPEVDTKQAALPEPTPPPVQRTDDARAANGATHSATHVQNTCDARAGATVPSPSPSPSPSVPSERAATPPVERFYKSAKRGDQVAALIDVAKGAGRELSGSRVGAMLKAHPKTAVMEALTTALGKNAAVLEDYMQGVLKNGPKTGRRAERRNAGAEADAETVREQW